MNIAQLSFENPVFLAPMAGVTDIAFRELCVEMGCALVYTEMVSAKALYYGSSNTQSLLRLSEKEKPVAVQIFGREPGIMAQVVEQYFNQNEDICLIDINMGCPAPKIVKNGEGSALMKEPKLASEIVSAIKKVCHKPVTVKFRKGFSKDEVTAIDFAKAMEQAGADAVAIHGRTREQMYEGEADWDIIAAVKQAVKIPVIGNGDVFSAEDALRMYQATNCDGIMVARGSQGNPWIFKQIIQSLSNQEVTYPKDSQRVLMAIKHYKLAIEYNGEYKALREMRKHVAFYIKGLKGCIEVKNAINATKSTEEAISILKDYEALLRHES